MNGKLFLAGLITGLLGIWLIVDAAGWQVAVGVFLLIWGDNVCDISTKKD